MFYGDLGKILTNSPKTYFESSGPYNLVIFSSPVLNLRLKVFTKLHDSSFKNTKINFSASQGGEILLSPSDTPLHTSKSFLDVKARSTLLYENKYFSIGLSELNE